MALLRLTPVVPGSNVPTIELGAGASTTIGRGQKADVIVDGPSLSRLHARLSMDQDGQISVDDLGSTNGVFVKVPNR
jgi:pSer/pThr/pTyr-binding forkhead associated (FHA) protein